MKWLVQYKIKEIGRKEQNFDNIPDNAHWVSTKPMEPVFNQYASQWV